MHVQVSGGMGCSQPGCSQARHTRCLGAAHGTALPSQHNHARQQQQLHPARKLGTAGKQLTLESSSAAGGTQAATCLAWLPTNTCRQHRWRVSTGGERQTAGWAATVPCRRLQLLRRRSSSLAHNGAVCAHRALASALLLLAPSARVPALLPRPPGWAGRPARGCRGPGKRWGRQGATGAPAPPTGRPHPAGRWRQRETPVRWLHGSALQYLARCGVERQRRFEMVVALGCQAAHLAAPQRQGLVQAAGQHLLLVLCGAGGRGGRGVGARRQALPPPPPASPQNPGGSRAGGRALPPTACSPSAGSAQRAACLRPSAPAPLRSRRRGPAAWPAGWPPCGPRRGAQIRLPPERAGVRAPGRRPPWLRRAALRG